MHRSLHFILQIADCKLRKNGIKILSEKKDKSKKLRRSEDTNRSIGDKN